MSESSSSSATHIADRLLTTCDTNQSVACIGLDPRPNLIPPAVQNSTRAHAAADRVAEAFVTFNRGIIAAAAGKVACVKPQVACYEAYGVAGLRALTETITAAEDAGLPVIVDAKRGDIGSTATHYREAVFGGANDLNGNPLPGWGGDWLTAHGYMGSDSVQPLRSATPSRHGLFVLVKTSNPGGADLQDQCLAETEAVTVADRMADLVAAWGATCLGTRGYSDLGAVVGATWPEQAQALRQRMPQQLFLVPGYGAQGGTASDALVARDSNGLGVLVNSSRGIAEAWQADPTGDWQEQIAAAIETMNADLNAARTSTAN